MAAILSYALDGAASPVLKARLSPNRVLEMHKTTFDQEPCLTKFGDDQRHHFIVEVPTDTKRMQLDLQGEPKLSSGEDSKLELFATPSPWPGLTQPSKRVCRPAPFKS